MKSPKLLLSGYLSILCLVNGSTVLSKPNEALQAIDPNQAQFDTPPPAPSVNPSGNQGADNANPFGGGIKGQPLGSGAPKRTLANPNPDGGSVLADPSPSSSTLPGIPGQAGQGWAPPANQQAEAVYEPRVARLEQLSFGSTYPEHDIDDRVDHLESEVFNKRSSGQPIDNRISQLESKLLGQTAFGQQTALPAMPSYPAPGMTPPGLQGSGPGQSQLRPAQPLPLAGTPGWANPGTSFPPQVATPQWRAPSSAPAMPPTAPVRQSPPQQNFGTMPQNTGGFTNPGSAGFQPAYNPTQQNTGGFPPQNAGGFPPQTMSGCPQQNTGGFPPQNVSGFPPQNAGGFPAQNNSGFTNPGSAGGSPAYNPTSQNYGGFGPQTSAGFPPQNGSGFPPQNAGGFSPQNGSGFPPQNAGGFSPQNVSGFPPQSPGGFPPQSPGGFPPQSAGGFPPQNAGGFPPQNAGEPPAPPGANAATSSEPFPKTGAGLTAADRPELAFDAIVKDMPLKSGAGDYYASINKFANGASVARWTRFPILVHFPQGSPAQWQKSLDEALAAWKQYIPVKAAEPTQLADIEIGWINHLPPRCLGQTNLEVFNGRMRVTVYLLRPSYYLPNIPDKVLKRVAMHELGHAIGLFGHSGDPGDLMYTMEGASAKEFVGTKSGGVSARDANTLKKIYESRPLPANYQSPHPLGWSVKTKSTSLIKTTKKR